MEITWNTSQGTQKRKRGTGNDFKTKEYDPRGSGYSTRITEAQWEQQKDFIEKLHHQGIPRAEMQATLKSEGFDVSLPQIHRQMGIWGFKVYDSRKQKQDTPINRDIAATQSSDTELKHDIEVASLPIADLEITEDHFTHDISSLDNLKDLIELPLFEGDAPEVSLSLEQQSPDAATRSVDFPQCLKLATKALENQPTLNESQWTDILIEAVKTTTYSSTYHQSTIYTLLADYFQICQWDEVAFKMAFAECLAVSEFRSQLSSHEDEFDCDVRLFEAIAMCTFKWPKQECPKELDWVCTQLFSRWPEQLYDLYHLQTFCIAYVYTNVVLQTFGSELPDWKRMLRLGQDLVARQYRQQRRLSKLGIYIAKFFTGTSAAQATRTEHAFINYWGSMHADFIRALLYWCKLNIHSITPIFLEYDKSQSAEVGNPSQPVYVALSLHFLYKWYLENPLGNADSVTADSDDEMTDRSKYLNTIHGVAFPHCMHCIQQLIETLAGIMLLVVSQALSVDLQEALDISDLSGSEISVETLDSALEYLQTMRSSELYYVLCRACYMLIFTSKRHRNACHQTSETHIGSTGLAFAQYLAENLNLQSLCAVTQCEKDKIDAEQASSPKDNASNQMKDDVVSVSSSRSSTFRSMLRIGKKPKFFKRQPSMESVTDFIMGGTSPQSRWNPAILSSKVSLLSFLSSRRGSSIISQSTMSQSDTETSSHTEEVES